MAGRQSRKLTGISEVVILYLGTQVGVLEVLILDFCESNHFGNVRMNAMLGCRLNNEEPRYIKSGDNRKLSVCGGEKSKMRFPEF